MSDPNTPVYATSRPVLEVSQVWPAFLWSQDTRSKFESDVLPHFLLSCRWFAGKARKLSRVSLRKMDVLGDQGEFIFCFLDTFFSTGKSETYQLILACVAECTEPHSGAVIAEVRGATTAVLVDAVYVPSFRSWLLEAMIRGGAHQKSIAQHPYFSDATGRWVAIPHADLQHQPMPLPDGRLPGFEQSNTSLLYGQRWFFKLYRKLFLQVNPEPGMVRCLSAYGFDRVPAYRGEIEWQPDSGARMTLGIWQQQIEGQGDLWALVLSLLKSGRAASHEEANQQLNEWVERLARRTAEMHNCLVRVPEHESDFSTAGFDAGYRESLKHHFDQLVDRRLAVLKDAWANLGEKARLLAQPFADDAARIRSGFSGLSTQPLQSKRIRIHGDYHLGQVVAQGHDVWILDFEGEPESSVADRMIRHSPLKDVAGMLRSFHYAAYVAYYFDESGVPLESADGAAIESWYQSVCRLFLSNYMQHLDGVAFQLGDPLEFRFLLQLHMLEKAVYELGYELNSRPKWAIIPLEGINSILNSSNTSQW